MEFNGTFLISAISFVVFVIIMNSIFYEPIAKIVKEREDFIDENFDEAKKNNLNFEKLIVAHSKKIDEANSKGKSIINEKSQKAKARKSELIKSSKIKASEDILNNKNELKTAFENTKSQIDINDLSNLVSSKLFGSFEGGQE